MIGLLDLKSLASFSKNITENSASHSILQALVRHFITRSVK